jgi:acyl-CoA synthetase (AMP-forming)/AMP-acid ligase II
VAAVVPVEGGQVDVKALFEVCLAGLERNSVPSFIQVVGDIPKTISEKNLDRVLREEFDPGAENVYKFEDYN